MPKVVPFLPLFDPHPDLGEPTPAQPQPPDARARELALDIHRSFLVEAPAGSGKTGLLIQRFLKLLCDESVTEPEQVLAITFTNKATAELRDRVLAHLESADLEPAHSEATHHNSTASAKPASPFDRQTHSLALAVLERDRQLDWSLLDHPQRLNIRTIDSVCAEIARTLPVISGGGGRLTPAADAASLHREAARRTLLLLGGGDPAFDHALRNLLLHRDGNLADCEALLANMLSLRDQWGDLIPLRQPHLEDAWLDTHVLPRLQLVLDQAICATLTQLAQLFPSDVLTDLTELARQLAELDGYEGNPSPLAICAGLHTPPQPAPSHLDHWLALIHLLVTADGSWRKERGINRKTLAIDYDRRHRHHASLAAIIDQLNHRDDLLPAFESVRLLPPARYPANQWAIAKSLFRVLSLALVELQLVFAERNQCDFTELNLLARNALGQDSGPDDLAAALGARLQHLLVDEMQDTSTSQYDLLELLTKSWDGYSQTVFLVGDPRQSIYLFRQARVERFLQAMQTERLGTLPLTRLRLTANFRSQRGLVDRFNHDFALIFAGAAAPSDNSIPYTEADATLPPSSMARGAVWHATPLAISSATQTPAQIHKQQAGRTAAEILRIARQWLTRPLPPDRKTIRDESGRQISEPWRIAVLVRSRTHLTEIVATFNQFNTEHPHARIPIRAVEIESLNQRQEVLDLTALTRALLHPADRIAALAVLRAPWCGLSLADLHTLTGADDPALKDQSILRLMADRGHLLPEDSCRRMTRVWTVLQAALRQRARLTTAQFVERAWRSLGGDAWLTPTQLANTRRFFQLLDSLEAESQTSRLDPPLLEQRLESLFAEAEPNPAGTPVVELLTIHKAKGLEWDAVLVPALERSPGRSSPRLLNWSEIDLPDSPASNPDRPAHIMLAPIAAKGENLDPLFDWVRRTHRAREAAEYKRLFYVACTRARQELHLFAAPDISARGDINPRYDSLLKAAWAAAESHFAAESAFPSPAPAQPESQDEFPALDLAAAAESTPPILQRVPAAFDPTARFAVARTHSLPCGETEDATASTQSRFARPEGSFAARAFGTAVHACLELLAGRIPHGASPAALLAELPAWTPRIAAILRADGLPRDTVEQLTRKTRTALENTLRDPDGLWLLASHPGAACELTLTALPQLHSPAAHAGLRAASVRVDRAFHAGSEPRAPGETHLWIIDYKTADHGPAGLESFLAAQRAAYGPQLETYARILGPARSRSLDQVRLALYFPTLQRLTWWTPTANKP